MNLNLNPPELDLYMYTCTRDKWVDLYMIYNVQINVRGSE